MTVVANAPDDITVVPLGEGASFVVGAPMVFEPPRVKIIVPNGIGHLVGDPAAGLLRVVQTQDPNGGYVPVRAVVLFQCGVDIEIPEGVTVEIFSVEEMEKRRLLVPQRRYEGAMVIKALTLSVTNDGASSGLLKPGDVIAGIRAYATQPKVSIECSHTPPKG